VEARRILTPSTVVVEVANTSRLELQDSAAIVEGIRRPDSDRGAETIPEVSARGLRRSLPQWH
jgi:hypothetical protein